LTLILKRPLIAFAYQAAYLAIQTPVVLPIFSLLRVCCSLALSFLPSSSLPSSFLTPPLSCLDREFTFFQDG
jgi:hypothetical protein